MKLLISTVFGIVVMLFCASCDSDPSKQYGVVPMEVTEAGLAWYKIDDLDKMSNLENKKIIVDMYTSWCKWCKVMDKKTFTDKELINYLNENYVMVKFNAERRNPVSLKGENYEWMKAGRRGVNKLAYKMMSGRLGYPTLVVLDQDKEVLTTIPGYRKPNELLSSLQSI